MSDFTQLPKNIANCMERAGAPLSEDQRLLLVGYLAPFQQELEQSKSGDAEKISSLKIDLAESSAEILEMANCLAECLEDINQAINATMRSGNGGKLWIDGKELSTHEVADRLENLMIKRDRILKALHPLREHKQCTYPDCQCPFDMGPDHQCLKGLPVIRK
ncbi:hypothetical protein [Marinobacter adhaerens]|uniref:Uncharacterized protein n=2 Tax=Marinobacter adhaerens TaxID=1033846 RepID=A0ABX8IHP2_9GAMM|nr:hypothetical protein [Marinobacter adhaerens]QWV11824.1 hypothetical protein KQ249_14145 [Marinobacter adhaerens]